MTKQTQKKLLVPEKKKTAQRKATPEFFSAIEKSKETSQLKSAETAAIENHYVNGSINHAKVNRGK